MPDSQPIYGNEPMAVPGEPMAAPNVVPGQLVLPLSAVPPAPEVEPQTIGAVPEGVTPPPGEPAVDEGPTPVPDTGLVVPEPTDAES